MSNAFSPRLQTPGRRQFCAGFAATLLALPGLASPASAQEGEKAQATANAGIRLHAAPGKLRLKPEPASGTATLAFNGQIPGPLMRVRQGETLSLELSNGLDDLLSLHWQGAGAPNALDGVAGLTGPAIAPGETRRLSFTTRHAGLSWYRPMRIGAVGRQTGSGLYGAVIVDETEPPTVAKDILLVLDDWALTNDAQLRPDFDTVAARAGAGRLGNWLTLNSAAPPGRVSVAPGSRLRLRLLNAANARTFALQFNGLHVHVIGVDGRPSALFTPARDSLTLLPGGRYDLIVAAPAQAGAEGALQARFGDAGAPLLVVTATDAPPAMAAGPVAALPAAGLPEAIRLQDSIRAALVMAGGASPGAPETAARFTDPARIWTINGVSWPEAVKKPAFSVRSGRPVTLELKNTTPWMQTLHIHGHHVRRLHNLDDGWEPYWLDVIAVPANHTSRVAFVAGEAGKWLIGSSIAERLDGGMATWFEVT